MNPLYILCDLPWVVFMVITIVLAPHRLLFTYLLGLASKNATIMLYPIPLNEGGGQSIGRMRYDLMWCTFRHGIADFLMIPVYLVATIHPWHLYDVLVKVICTSRIQYDTVYQVDLGEGVRR